MTILFTIVLLVVLIVLISIIIQLIWNNKLDRKNLPPQPKQLPILGYLPFIKRPIYQAFTDLRKKYGEIVSVQIGSLQFIFLNSYKVLKLAMLDNADNFSGRLQSEHISRATHSCGIILTEGPRWIENHRFLLRVLRDFGFGRSLSEEIIQRESEAMVDYINLHLGEPVKTMNIFTRSASNVISTLALGDRPGYEDSEFSQVMDKLLYVSHNTDIGFLPIIFPVLCKIVPLINFIFGKSKVDQFTEDGHNYIQGKIEVIRARMGKNHIPMNITEAFLIEQAKQNLAHPEGHFFCNFQLMRLIYELFISGTDTLSTMLTWSLCLLSLYPEIQLRVQNEINEAVGQARLPNLRDKKHLPYTSAVMDEIARFSSLAPNAIPHRNFKQATINGFTIPAGSIIIPNIHAVHTDPEVWEKPEQFYPEHFLNACGKYISREELVTFGIGKRSCLGESLARSEFFVFFITMMQKYTVQLHDEETLDKAALLIGTDGVVRGPGDHRIIFTMR